MALTKLKNRANRHRHQRWSLLCLILLLAACGKPHSLQATDPPYRPVANPQQLMQWILDPAADVIWDSAGTIITAEGRQELAPTTSASWESVSAAAVRLSEAGNLLMLPGRSMGKDWEEYSQALVNAGEQAFKASEARDADGLFDAGGQIFQVCKACHAQYWIREDDGR